MQETEPDFSTLFSTIHLPTLPQTLIRLMEVCNDPEVDIVLVGKTAAQDVFIAAKILKLANSAFLGTRSKFVNIEQAVIYLGVDTVRNLAISVSIHDAFQEGTHFQNMNREEFWYHSLLTALLAKEIAELAGHDEPAEAYLAGLLHDIGKCLLNNSFVDQYSELLRLHGDSEQFHEKERETFGGSHADAGAWLAKNWHLKPALSRAIRLHHTPLIKESSSVFETIVFLANLLASERQAAHDQLEMGASLLGIESSTLTQLLPEQQTAVMEIASVLGIAVSVPEPTQEGRAKDKDKTQAERKADKPPSVDKLIKKVASLAQVYGILDNLVKAQTLNRVFLVLEESVHILFDVEKCILLLPNTNNSFLTVHGSFRNRLIRPLRGLRIPLQDNINLLKDSLNSRTLLRVKAAADLPEDNPTRSLFDAFAEEELFSLSFPITDTHRGLLILAESRPAGTLTKEQEESLLLLSSHIGSRLHLEVLKKQHAQSLARERIATMEEVAQSLAHEISNPLSIIQNYISLLADEGGLVTNMQEELGIISREIERIATLSKQLNDLSATPGARGQKLTHIETVMNDCLQIFKHSAFIDKKASIDLHCEPDLPAISIRPDALRQILNNLLSNSLEAIGFDGKIEIHCSHRPAAAPDKGEEIVISVADDGPGVSPTIAAKLFRAGQTTKGKGHAGIGLAIVQKLTNDLNGRIYHSTTGEGLTQFTLHLPVKSSYEA